MLSSGQIHVALVARIVVFRELIAESLSEKGATSFNGVTPVQCIVDMGSQAWSSCPKADPSFKLP
jgi:hypothetical protein